MVNTGFEGDTTTILKSELPEIQISLNTFTSLNPITSGQTTVTSNRFCAFQIKVVGIKLPLAYSTFSRIFGYIQNLAINDINPIPNVNSDVLPNTPTALGSLPKSICNISVDRTELTPTVTLDLSSENLIIDYMDEFFNRTLAYLQSAMNQDLNPG